MGFVKKPFLKFFIAVLNFELKVQNAKICDENTCQGHSKLLLYRPEYCQPACSYCTILSSLKTATCQHVE
jgi:hypothetical protein